MELANTKEDVREYILKMVPYDTTGNVNFVVAIYNSPPGLHDEKDFTPAIAGDSSNQNGTYGHVYITLMIGYKEHYGDIKIELNKINIIPTPYTGASNTRLRP